MAYLSLGYGGGESGEGAGAYKANWYGTTDGKLNMNFRRADGTFDYGKVQDLNEKSESGSQMVMTMSNNQHRWYGLVSTFTKELSQRLNVYAGLRPPFFMWERTITASPTSSMVHTTSMLSRDVKAAKQQCCG